MSALSPSPSPSPPILGRRVFATLAAAAATGLAVPARAQYALFDLPFVDDLGRTFRLSQWAGQSLMVNFYATWCAPCRIEMPSMDRLAGLRPDLAVLPISVERIPAQQLRQFYRSMNLVNLPIFQDPRGQLAGAANVWGYPTTLLIDARGVEVARITTALDWASPATLAELDSLLGLGGGKPG